MRKGFETALEDIKNEFKYLTDYGFVFSGQTQLEHRVSIGYRGSKYNLLINYELMEQNFDFNIINSKNPNDSIPFWKIIQELDTDFNYDLAKPNLNEHKYQLHYLAVKFKAVLPSLLSK